MEGLLHTYQQFIAQHRMFSSHHRLLLAISGGLDSVVLLHLTIASGYEVEIAHANFRLRGEESDRDEQFVRQLGAEYGVPVHIRHLDTEDYARHHKLSIQEAARALRYQWFRDLLLERDLHCTVTAHHADDNVETMLMNLFKGTGMAGLRGIQPLHEGIARPLLFASRGSLEAYAAAHGLAYVTDSSNLTDKYTRNYFRIHVIPLIEQVYPGTMDNLRQNMQRFREAEQLYRQAVDRKLHKLKQAVGQELHIPLQKLRAAAPLHTLVFELFRPYGFTARQVPEILQFLDASTGSVMYSATHRLLMNRNWLILSVKAPADMSIIPIAEEDTTIEFPGGQVHLQKMQGPGKPEDDPRVACLDARSLQYPLMLRKWKAGDYFYPLGLNKKKKLARFFIDQKLSLADKEKTWVLESGGRILWVLGHRIDHRTRLTPGSREWVRIHWTTPAL